MIESAIFPNSLAVNVLSILLSTLNMYCKLYFSNISRFARGCLFREAEVVLPVLVEYRFGPTIAAVFLFLKFTIQIKKGQAASPVLSYIDEDKRMMSLRFNHGLQI